MKKIFKHIFTVTAIALLYSCTTGDEGYEDFTIPTTAVEQVSGDWFLIAYFPDGSIAYGGGYELYTLSNTASDNTDAWIDDHGNFLELKTKVTVNGLSFSGPENGEEMITGGTVTITDGRVIKNGAMASITRTVVDSISFKAEFDWDPGTLYTVAGHKKTGFLEDEH